jgi:translation initiation factor IF-2
MPLTKIKSAMQGMLAPEFEEKVVCNIEIREVFNITKVGTIAGCMVLDGKVTRNTKVRVIRDGIVIHTGELGSLKRFKRRCEGSNNRLRVWFKTSIILTTYNRAILLKATKWLS